MAKKKKASKNTDYTDMITFRPGAELGQLITRFADQNNLSRGEVARRAASLALRDMDLGFYALIEEAATLSYGCGFEEASHQIHVAIIQAEVDRSKADAGVKLGREQKLDVARNVVGAIRMLRGESLEEQPEKIKVYQHRLT